MKTDTTTTTTELSLLDPAEVHDDQRNPMIGLVGFMSGFCGLGAAYVAVARHNVGIVAQLGVAAVVCGGLALGMLRAEH